jgi:hypothetical protein
VLCLLRRPAAGQHCRKHWAPWLGQWQAASSSSSSSSWVLLLLLLLVLLLLLLVMVPGWQRLRSC